MGHTPGPWKSWVTNSNRVAIVSLPGRSWIEISRKRNPNFDDDARLISAAPDMLETCEALVNFIKNGDYADLTPLYHEIYEQARSAITKAKGE